MGNKISATELNRYETQAKNGLGELLNPANYEPLPIPRNTDWLSHIKERGQSFEQYLNSKYTKPDELRNTIYIVPVDTSGTKDNEDIYYEKISEYVSIFFQMKTVVLDKKVISLKNTKSKINEVGQTQFLANNIWKNLKRNLPDDAFCVIGITTKDLYSTCWFSKDYQFVFGEASYSDRVGIFSIARFSPDFYKCMSDQEFEDIQKEFGINFKEVLSQDSLLNRSLKIVTHEILHMFSMDHCIYYNCLMRGCSGLHELDQIPFNLCPVCIRKLYIAHNFNASERQTKLYNFRNNT